ncbi:hypothetical protein ACMD2_15489 [Ananas comosus]|uniref:Uncharacterized protein n=1 Tax=Ananas comosus TaxID=4615 RepID=A0A199W7Y4_ANACO|nr:hypothetical protein ACMD2_15489 [Ananas comosus]
MTTAEEEKDSKKNSVKIEKAKEEGDDSDDDCYEIDPIDFARILTLKVSDEVVLVSEKEPVALRDFPHPRHLCANFPFNTSPHESYCSQIKKKKKMMKKEKEKEREIVVWLVFSV